MSNRSYPLRSLEDNSWFKLICGASFQHLPAVSSLALVYTLAGADCIDVAADPAVIRAAKEGSTIAATLAQAAKAKGFSWRGLPWLMVSLNDGEDPHFRKAEFDASRCPPECPRPCQSICPAQAIAFREGSAGVSEARCYGCGRCLPICPLGLIMARSYVSTPSAIAPLIEQMEIDALEIHTQVGHLEDFRCLWQLIVPYVGQLKLLSISCPDNPEVIDYLYSLYELINPLPCPLMWQTDGRPMSGDIGSGTTHAAIKLAQKVLKAGLPGYVQLAGGTNDYTVTKLKQANLLKDRRISPGDRSPSVSGIAYGSYARSLLSPLLEQLEAINYQQLSLSLNKDKSMKLTKQPETIPDVLWQAFNLASSLVKQIKSVSDSQLLLPQR